MATPSALKPLAAAMQATNNDEPDDLSHLEGTTDDELLVTAANMNIHRFVPKKKPGIYDEQVETLLKVDQETGYQNSIEILVPAAEVKKHKRYFTLSAGNFEKGARIVNGETGEPQGDGGALLEFVLTDKVVRKTKPKTDADAPTPA